MYFQHIMKFTGTHRPSVTTSLQQRKAGRRISHGIVTGTNNDCPTGNHPSVTGSIPVGVSIPGGVIPGGCGSQTITQATPRTLRMGTRTSFSALHRERLRLTSDISVPPRNLEQILTGFPGLKPRSLALDLDYDTMEYKSIMPEKVRFIRISLMLSVKRLKEYFLYI